MKVAIYTRVSTERQSQEGFSLEAQHDQLIQYVKANGWDLLRIYTDPGVSAKDLNRPGVQEMIRDMKAGLLDAVLVHKLDRLTRNISDLHEMVELVNRLNIKLVSLSENIDTSTVTGRVFVYFLGIMAQMFRENIREEVLKGMTKRAEKGFRNGGSAPYGYSADWTIDETQAVWVRRIFDWYIEKGWGYARICKELNLRNVPGGRGGEWHQNIVQYVLSNVVYTGKISWHVQDKEPIIRQGDHTPIVTDDLFERAQIQMKRRSDGDMVRSFHEYPFSGILKCGTCGRPFYGRMLKHKYGNYNNYRCTGKQKYNACSVPDISEKKLEILFFEQLRLLEQGVIIEAEVAAASETDQERQHIRQELQRSETRRKNWTYAMGDGKLPYPDFARLMDEEMQRVKQLQERLHHLPEEEKEAPVTYEKVLELARDLPSKWPYWELLTKKNFIQMLFSKIELLHDGQWKILRME